MCAVFAAILLVRFCSDSLFHSLLRLWFSINVTWNTPFLFLSFVNTCTFSQMVHVLILFTLERQQHVFLARLFGYHCDMMSEKRMRRKEFGIYFYIVVCFHSLLFTVNQDMCALLFSSILFHLYFCSLFSTEHSIWDYCWTLSLQYNDIDWIWFSFISPLSDYDSNHCISHSRHKMTRWIWNVRSHSAAAAAALNLTYLIFQFHTHSPHGVAERERAVHIHHKRLRLRK